MYVYIFGNQWQVVMTTPSLHLTCSTTLHYYVVHLIENLVESGYTVGCGWACASCFPPNQKFPEKTLIILSLH